MTRYGRVQSVPPLQLHRLHITAAPSALREIQHDVPIPVLNQQSLQSQGIDTSKLVKGAQRVDALGSCTCNAGTAHLAERLAAAGQSPTPAGRLRGLITGADGNLYGPGPSAKESEEFAILLYHAVTDQTGDPASEWPPADCGSSGYYVCTELEKQGLASTYKSASGILGALSLLQSGTVMQGTPFFYAWEEPDASGFIDGDGSVSALETALGSGVAGGHETLLTGIEKLTLTGTGSVDLQNTVLRVRNSWGPSWGDSGDFLVHASTLDYLAQYVDFKAIVI